MILNRIRQRGYKHMLQPDLDRAGVALGLGGPPEVEALGEAGMILQNLLYGVEGLSNVWTVKPRRIQRILIQ
jgi:hypothetical protein